MKLFAFQMKFFLLRLYVTGQLKIGKVFYSKKEGRKSILGCGTDEGT